MGMGWGDLGRVADEKWKRVGSYFIVYKYEILKEWKTVIFLNKKSKETMINWKYLAYELLELGMNFKQVLNDPLIS